jgi:hypothetical protein
MSTFTDALQGFIVTLVGAISSVDDINSSNTGQQENGAAEAAGVLASAVSTIIPLLAPLAEGIEALSTGINPLVDLPVATATYSYSVSQMVSAYNSYSTAAQSGDSTGMGTAGTTMLTEGVAALGALGGIMAAIPSVAIVDGAIVSVSFPMAGVGLMLAAVAAILTLPFSPTIQNLANKLWNDITGALNGPSQPSGAAGAAAGQIGQANKQTDPLVLDLTGGGINLTALSSASPYFDFANDGFATETAWIGAGTGFLVIDPSGENITNGTQLIDSFAQLEEYNANGDGVISESDPIYSQLRVWVDANGNGVTDSGELYTLSQLGITSINLTATEASTSIEGNPVNLVGSYTLQDGTTREIAAVSLTTNPTDTEGGADKFLD